MPPAPTTLCGVARISARPGAEPTVLGSADVRLTGGASLKLMELEWQLDQFEVEDAELVASVAMGSIRTFRVVLPDAELDLEQFDSSFWSSAAVRAEAVEVNGESRGSNAPKWRHRANRYWPHVGGVPVPFIGQAHLVGGDVYLFRMVSGPVLAHRVVRFEQDVESHYDGEGL